MSLVEYRLSIMTLKLTPTIGQCHASALWRYHKTNTRLYCNAKIKLQKEEMEKGRSRRYTRYAQTSRQAPRLSRAVP
jgi:hypothetical protein